MYLLKSSEFSFINHDSVLKLNDIRTVSVNRILYQQNGQIPPPSNTYKQIEQLVLKKYFPDFYHDYKERLEDIFSLEEQLKKSNTAKEKLELENEKLHKQILGLTQ